MLLRADHSYCRDDRVGAQGKSAYRLRMPSLLTEQFQKDPSRQLCSLGMKRSRSAINVVITLQAGGEREIAKPE